MSDITRAMTRPQQVAWNWLKINTFGQASLIPEHAHTFCAWNVKILTGNNVWKITNYQFNACSAEFISGFKYSKDK